MKNKLLTSKANLNLIGFIALLMLLIPSLGWSQYSGSGTFTKITSTSDLTDGYYVIAYGATQAMNNVNGSNNYFGNTAISPTGGTTITNPNAAIVWKIQTDGGGKTIYNESSAKYVSYTGSSNQAQEVSSVTSNNQRFILVNNSDYLSMRFSSFGSANTSNHILSRSFKLNLI